jgi:hypothetical protein
MSNTKEFDDLKQKIYLAYHQDGILDLTTATILLGFSAFMATKSVVFLSVGAIFAAQYLLMKQRITIPRFGYVQFVSKKKNLAQQCFLLGLGMLVLLAIFVGKSYVSNMGNTPEMQALIQRYHMVPLSAMLFGLPTLVAAVFLGLKRFYLYAFLAVVLPALGAWMNIETFIPILATGLVSLAYGLGLLSNFLKKYPVKDLGCGDVNG